MTERTVVATGLEFPEGPVAMEDGSVLVVEMRGKTLTTWASLRWRSLFLPKSVWPKRAREDPTKTVSHIRA